MVLSKIFASEIDLVAFFISILLGRFASMVLFYFCLTLAATGSDPVSFRSSPSSAFVPFFHSVSKRFSFLSSKLSGQS